MTDKTNVKSPEEFSIFSRLLEFTGVIGEWSDNVFDGRYNECLAHMQSGGYAYFEVDYDVPDVIVAKFVMLS